MLAGPRMLEPEHRRMEGLTAQSRASASRCGSPSRFALVLKPEP